ncbi:DEAH-box ATP-dependent RNA helicase prp43 [Dimargaris xerosporica]|nr:DEAH-box ATP-dependent RNA helicase prp43 [Dimargaris xerosporica]
MADIGRRFAGLTPGNSTAQQAMRLENGNVNPFTGKPFSDQYRALLKSRRQLPVAKHRNELLQLVYHNQFVVLVGETGSGKTTQVPQYLAYALLPQRKAKVIAVTQPRRLPAENVAQRVADEMDVILGKEVGYSVRFDGKYSDRTVIKYMTDGKLLQEAMYDRTLRKYAAIVIDEVHERSVTSDILMGTVKHIAQDRADLKVVVMSATMQIEKLQQLFTDAQILMVKGRTHPVTIIYEPAPVSDILQTIAQKVFEIHHTKGEGDILVFLSGGEQIQQACNRVTAYCRDQGVEANVGPLVVVPLYAWLAHEEQCKAFCPAPPPECPDGRPGRKCIIATNIAETSLTIPGIVYVIDSGQIKVKTYDYKARIEALEVHNISQESAMQRSGRAGRTRPGICYRLYTQEWYNQLEEEPCPEIMHCHLGTVLLWLKRMGVINPQTFELVDRLPDKSVKHAKKYLIELGALENCGNLTALGKNMSKLPIAPELGRMLLISAEYQSTNAITAIVAMLETSPIFLWRPNDTDHGMADGWKATESSDHLTLLNIFQTFYGARGQCQSSEWCRANGLNYHSLVYATKAYIQLKRYLRDMKFGPRNFSCSSHFSYSNICRALTAGLFIQSAYRLSPGVYCTARYHHYALLDRWSFVTAKPKYVVFSQHLNYGAPIIRCVTETNLNWLRKAAPDRFNENDYRLPGSASSAKQRPAQSGAMEKRTEWLPVPTMDSSDSLKAFMVDNGITDWTPPQDLVYHYDSAAHAEQLKAKPWQDDPNYFTHVRVSAVALVKMITHAQSGGDLEIMGLLQGKVQDRTLLVMDVFALPVEGTETRVNAQDEAYEYMVDYLIQAKEASIDVNTQMINQQFQDPWVAIVVDPKRTMAAGKVDLGAFRTYPKGYQPPGVPASEYQHVPLHKIEDFGVHCNQYYPLDVTYFKSALDTVVLERLWTKYWVNTLSQSPLIQNRTYFAGQMADLTKKLGHAKGAKSAKATTSASSKQVPPTSQLSKET